MNRARVVVLVAALIACKKDPQKAEPGSASVVVVAVDAAPVTAEASLPDDAVPDAATVGLTISKDGLSFLPNYKRTGKTETEVVTDLQSKLAAYTVSFEVMEYADEHEEGYFSVKQGDTEIIQMFRTENDGIDVRVMGSMIPTADGIKTGDKLSVLAAKYPALACTIHKDSEIGLLQCTAGGLVYVLDARKYKGKQSGKLDVAKVADLPIFMIAAGL
jgi:hypothetical protein